MHLLRKNNIRGAQIQFEQEADILAPTTVVGGPPGASNERRMEFHHPSANHRLTLGNIIIANTGTKKDEAPWDPLHVGR